MPNAKAARPASLVMPEGEGAAAPDPDQIAEGLRDLAAAIREGTETFRPAAETVHGFGARLDALCTWVTGLWPWILAFGLYAMQQAAPELYEAIKSVLASVTPAS